MPKKNQIKFRDFRKVLTAYVEEHFDKWDEIQKSGSAIRYEIFDSKKDQVPSKMWVVHQDTYVHSGDLKKTCQNLGITVDDFMNLL